MLVEISFYLTQILMKWSLQQFCTWHVAYAIFFVIILPAIEVLVNEISIGFELWQNYVSEMGPNSKWKCHYTLTKKH